MVMCDEMVDAVARCSVEIVDLRSPESATWLARHVREDLLKRLRGRALSRAVALAEAADRVVAAGRVTPGDAALLRRLVDSWAEAVQE